MKKLDQSTAFAMFQDYVGEALKIFRVGRDLTQEELAAKLSEHIGEHISAQHVNDVESSAVEISEQRFEEFCAVLEYTPEWVLKAAQGLKEDEGRPEKEVDRELLQEVKYVRWKRKEGDGSEH